MKNYIVISVLILVVIFVFGCIGTGNYGYISINETGNLSEFDHIVVSGTAPNHLIVTQGDEESLSFEAGRNEISNVKTGVSNNRLYLNSTTPVTYYVTVKDINSIELMGPGPGNMQSNNLKLNNLAIKINNGACNITNINVSNLTLSGEGFYVTNVTTNDLTINASSCNITDLMANNLFISGRGIYISGKATNQKASIHGAYNATNLISKTATISVDGAGDATIRVSDLLNAIINGPGDIYYLGNPKITQQINGPGTIIQICG